MDSKYRLQNTQIITSVEEKFGEYVIRSFHLHQSGWFDKKKKDIMGSLLSGSCHLDRASNVEIGVECQIFVIVLTVAAFYSLGRIQGIIRVH